MRAASFCVTSALSLGLAFVAARCGKETTAPSDAGPISLSVVSGDGQSGIAGAQLAQPLIVKVTVNGYPRPLQVLNFRVVSGNGSVFGGTELTDLRGMAQELWTLGAKAGDAQKVEVRAVDPVTGAAQVFATFTATALPGPATTLAVSGLPNPADAGVSSPVTVTAKDALGNTATGYRGTVHFSSTDPQSILPANHSFVAGDGGVFAGAVTLKTPGLQTVTATDVVTGSISGSQTVVVAAPPVITSFTAAATSITAGTSTTLTAVFSGGSAAIDNRVGPVISGAAVSTGILTSTTTFTLTVTNVVGATVTAAVTVTVAPSLPTILLFTGQPNPVASGGFVNITALFTGGAGSLTHDEVVDPILSGAVVTVGPLVRTTIFTLVVTNGAGASALASLTVQVAAAPFAGIWDLTPPISATCTGSGSGLVPSVSVAGLTTSVPSPGQLLVVLQVRFGAFTANSSLPFALDEATGNFSGSGTLSQSAGGVTVGGSLAVTGTFTGSDAFTAAVDLTDFTIVGNVLGLPVNLQCGPVSSTVTGTRSSN